MHHERFATEGFALVPGVLSAQECKALARSTSGACASVAGTRCLLSQPWCTALVPVLRAQKALSALVSESFLAVQCTYFEKSASLNWLVPIHQDLSIPVAQRVCHPELRVWSVKEGALFVQPPPSLLEHMVAVRVHLDDCASTDGPLRVVPGSHLSGVIPPQVAVEARSREVVCVAERGAALAMRPLLLHSSSKASGRSLRRVLHFLFGPPELPYGLSWQSAV
jgi:ectoine hydroxylase-related dioxygenase (phytanoyl-CoA dioxygenase family)